MPAKDSLLKEPPPGPVSGRGKLLAPSIPQAAGASSSSAGLGGAASSSSAAPAPTWSSSSAARRRSRSREHELGRKKPLLGPVVVWNADEQTDEMPKGSIQCCPGMKVVRGPDWQWGDQDTRHNNPGGSGRRTPTTFLTALPRCRRPLPAIQIVKKLSPGVGDVRAIHREKALPRSVLVGAPSPPSIVKMLSPGVGDVRALHPHRKWATVFFGRDAEPHDYRLGEGSTDGKTQRLVPAFDLRLHIPPRN